MSESGSAAGARSRQWSSTPQIRSEILAAAERVFQDKGYADASIAEIVELSGASVGSVYHHFGGKAEVFLALWETNQSKSLGSASKAVAAAKKAGDSGGVELFLLGARAYLESVWKRRHLFTVFVADDGPLGFEAMRRQNWRRWIRQNTTLLEVGDDIPSRILVSVVTSVIADGAREMAALETQSDAELAIATTLGYVSRVLRT